MVSRRKDGSKAPAHDAATDPSERDGKIALPVRATNGSGNGDALVGDTAHYIAQMAGELSALARASNLDLLAYFLDMARIEAASTARKADLGL